MANTIPMICNSPSTTAIMIAMFIWLCKVWSSEVKQPCEKKWALNQNPSLGTNSQVWSYLCILLIVLLASSTYSFPVRVLISGKRSASWIHRFVITNIAFEFATSFRNSLPSWFTWLEFLCILKVSVVIDSATISLKIQ